MSVVPDAGDRNTDALAESLALDAEPLELVHHLDRERVPLDGNGADRLVLGEQRSLLGAVG